MEILFSHLINEYDFYTFKNDFTNIAGLIKECVFLRKLYDNFHITGDCHYVGIFLIGRNVTHTYHDFNYLSSLRGIKYFLYKFVWVDLPIFLSKEIIFVSPFTKNAAFRLSKAIKKKGLVINNCVPYFESKKTKSTSSNKKIIAFNTGPQKNIDTLILSLDNFKNIELHIIGEPLKQKKSSNFSIMYYTDLSHEKLQLLYNSCDLLWFVSIYEGFGMPVIEAQQIQIPVITSNNSSLAWVSGDGAILVDNPKSIDENTKALFNGLYNETIINNVVKNGIINTKRFSVSEFKRSYISFFNSITL